MEFSRQEFWSGLPFSLPRDFPDPGIKPGAPALAGGFLITALPGKPLTRAVVQIQEEGIQQDDL